MAFWGFLKFLPIILYMLLLMQDNNNKKIIEKLPYFALIPTRKVSSEKCPFYAEFSV